MCRCVICDGKLGMVLVLIGALWESDATNFFKPNGQSRNLNVYVHKANILSIRKNLKKSLPEVTC